MAFMSGPRLVLLDEPAGGVNLTMLGALEERLAAFNRERGATFVVIEHNMDFVMSLCTRVIVPGRGPRARRRVARRGARQSRRDRGLSWTLSRSSNSTAWSPATAP